MTRDSLDPERYVRENRDVLVRILKHGDDEFVRGLAIKCPVRYGDDPLIEDVERELERAKEDWE